MPISNVVVMHVIAASTYIHIYNIIYENLTIIIAKQNNLYVIFHWLSKLIRQRLAWIQ